MPLLPRMHPAARALLKRGGGTHALLPHIIATGGVAALRKEHWERLRDAGIAAVVFDRDNTLAVPHGQQKDSLESLESPRRGVGAREGGVKAVSAAGGMFDAEVAASVRACADVFGGWSGSVAAQAPESCVNPRGANPRGDEVPCSSGVFVLSNAACNAVETHERRAAKFASALALPVVAARGVFFAGNTGLRAFSGQQQEQNGSISSVSMQMDENEDFRKPGEPAARLLRRALAEFGPPRLSRGEVDLRRVAYVGDRLLTDALFANEFGMLSIWTRPLVPEAGAAMRAMVAMERALLGRTQGLPRHGLVEAELCAQISAEAGES
jgi:predicted HAD superfamily phosphohydrolase YqeG